MSLVEVVGLLALASVASAGVWGGSALLERSTDRLSAHYGLPAIVQGAVVTAIASSFPELSSVVLSTLLHGEFALGIGAIVGSAIFNVLVIPAVCGLLADGELEADRLVVYKEAQFYMIAVSALVVTFAMAVIYFPVEGSTLQGNMTRGLALIPLLLYGLYVFIQWQDVADHEAGDPPDGVDVGRQWALLGAGLLVILVTVEQLVAAVDSLARTVGMPEFLAGVVIIAAATSLPDTLVSVRSARAGKHITSLGNVLGSNTFDLLVAIPLGVLIVGTVTINFSVAVPMMGVLTVATIFLFTVLRTDMGMSDLEAYGLLGMYLLFVAWIVAETVGLTSVIRTG